jgi:DNA polymerase
MVGEQPGEREDVAGRPFVGPAGAVLDKAMVRSGLDRTKVFLTNAVKHFKFEQRGKKRLHKRPNAYEIDRCHLWLSYERKLIRPSVIVALGATAARSLIGRAVTIAQVRGEAITLDDGGRVIVTIHPSWLLRMRDRTQKDAEFERLVQDLKLARRIAA